MRHSVFSLPILVLSTFVAFGEAMPDQRLFVAINAELRTSLGPGAHRASIYLPSQDDSIDLGRFEVPQCPAGKQVVVGTTFYASAVTGDGTMVIMSEDSEEEFRYHDLALKGNRVAGRRDLSAVGEMENTVVAYCLREAITAGTGKFTRRKSILGFPNAYNFESRNNI